MKNRMIKKVCIIFVLISLIYNLVIQAIIGAISVQATTHKYYDVFTRETMGWNTMAGVLEYSFERDNATLIKNEFCYLVTYNGSGEIYVWDDDVSTFKVGKELQDKYFGTVTITRFEKIDTRYFKRNGSDKKAWRCAISVRGNKKIDYIDQFKTVKDFESYIVGPFGGVSSTSYFRVTATEVGYWNKKTWKVAILRTFEVEDNNSTATNGAISKFKDASTELIKAAEEAAKAVKEIELNKTNNTSNSNTNTNTNTQVDPTTTLTFNNKTCDACFISLKNSGFSVSKPTETTIVMNSKDVEKVTSLELKGKEISDLSGLSRFKNLKKLDIGSNNVDSFSKISELTNLEELVINNNKIKSLKEIEKLNKLRILNLNGNELTEISEISQLTNLDKLFMSHCKLKTFTVNLSNLTKLQEIWLENNCLNSDSIKNIATASNLNKLYIGKNQIKSLAELSKLTNLKELYANENYISDISNLNYISNISINNNTINIDTNSILMDMPVLLQEAKNQNSKLYTSENFECVNCVIKDGKIQIDPNVKNATIVIKGGNANGTKIIITNLFKSIALNDRVLAERIKNQFGINEVVEKDGKYVLTLSEANINAKKSLDLSTPNGSTEKIKDISGIENFKQLTSINLRNNEISNFEPLSRLEKLETLDARFNNISNFNSLKQLKSLRQLDVSNNRITSIDGIQNLENLKDLLLSNNNIKNNLQPLNGLSDSLSTLSLINNGISDISGLSRLKLSTLYLGYNEIGDISAINFDNLDHINIENNRATININGKTTNLPKILLLDMNENGGISNLECTGCTINNNIVTLDDGVKLGTIKVKNGKLKDTVFMFQDNNALEAPKLNVTYELRNNDTEMLVTINADKEIQTVLGWDRINNSTAVQKIYKYNVSNEVITILDMYGNETNQLIEFTGVKNSRIPDLTVSYSDKIKTNSDVTVTISSSENLHNVANGWRLNEDGKSISKTYTENTNHTYTTILLCTERMFNIQMQPVMVEVELSIIDKKNPECTVEYSETNTTKGSVRATIWADEEIEGVNLTQYTKTKKIDENGRTKYGIVIYYSDNSSDLVIVRDLVHNIKLVDVVVNNIDKTVDGLYAKTNVTNSTKDNVEITIGANERISLNNGIVTAKNIVKKNDLLLKVAYTNNYAQRNTEPLVLLGETNSLDDSENTIVVNLSERELGVVEATDMADNIDLVLINTSMIDKEELTVFRQDTENEDGSITVLLKTNKPIFETGDLGNWELSENGQELTQIFRKNTNEILRITDIMGDTLDYEFSINGLNNINYSISYYPIEGTNQAFVIIESDVLLREIDGWDISEDKKCLCKKISSGDSQVVVIYDADGNEQEINIEYSYDKKEIESEEKNDGSGSTKEDNTQTDKVIPNAGKYTAFVLIISSFLTIITFFTLKKYKDDINNY